MALSEPKPKKNFGAKPLQDLPLIRDATGEFHRFRGVFNGFSVVVEGLEDMKKLTSMGYFGKATLSRNYPQFRRHSPEIIRKRVFENRQRHSDRKNKVQKIVVVPDSDSEEDLEAYFTNLKPEYQLDSSGINETVNLGLEESFFLSSALNCFDIYHRDKLLKPEETWELFKETDRHFVTNYVAYYHFRSKNWVVKPGIKFGGDFLLYKQGPPFYHASYVVIIHVIDEDLKKIESLSRRSMKTSCLTGLHRLCETAGKELLICEIVYPSDLSSEVNSDDLPKFTVKETIMKRWLHQKTSRN